MDSLKRCPFCGEEILAIAVKCKHCGSMLTQAREVNIDAYLEKRNSYNAGIGALLSLIIPGAGQMYRGDVMRGFIFLIFTVLGYFLIVPGLIIHIISIIEAATVKPKPSQSDYDDREVRHLIEKLEK